MAKGSKATAMKVSLSSTASILRAVSAQMYTLSIHFCAKLSILSFFFLFIYLLLFIYLFTYLHVSCTQQPSNGQPVKCLLKLWLAVFYLFITACIYLRTVYLMLLYYFALVDLLARATKAAKEEKGFELTLRAYHYKSAL